MPYHLKGAFNAMRVNSSCLSSARSRVFDKVSERDLEPSFHASAHRRWSAARGLRTLQARYVHDASLLTNFNRLVGSAWTESCGNDLHRW